ncbi:MAG: hypothetical protein JSS14_23040 [Proteobacteria bacterium]|nr:hypothetical protein [Pseudomonadota bacterium]
MPSLLPLSPGLAHALPWRMRFRSTLEPATLDRFADPDFVSTLTPDELDHCEKVLTTLLGKMLKTRRYPRRVGRLRVCREVSQKVLEERGTAGIAVSLGDMRFTVIETANWIGDSLSRFIKAVEPDLGAPAQIPSTPFTPAEYEDIGFHGAAPAAVGGPKPRPAAKPAEPLELTPPPDEESWRKRENPVLRLRAASGQVILGNDVRLGWMLFEAHKVVRLDQEHVLAATDLIERLAGSRRLAARELGALLDATLKQLERATVTEEIRSVLAAMRARAKVDNEAEPWTVENLYWAFGVDGPTPFDPSFWGSGSPRALALRRKLLPLTDIFASHSLYSPALGVLRTELAAIELIGARRLRAQLGPLLGNANVIGVCKFMNEVLSIRDGTMSCTVLTTDEHEEELLFYWSRSTLDARTTLRICYRARDLTLAYGAFSIDQVLSGLSHDMPTRVAKQVCLEILSEWTPVRWFVHSGWGVVEQVSPLPALAQRILHATYPKAVAIEDLLEGCERALQNNLQVQAARKLVEGQHSVDLQVLLEVLHGAGAITRSGTNSLKFKGEPDNNYWDWNPIESELVEFIQECGGTALNREIYKRFQGDKSVEHEMLAEALRVLPYLDSPTPLKTSLRPWLLKAL